MLLPSSAIRIIESTPTKLMIVDPPYYGLGVAFLVVSVIGAAIWLHPTKTDSGQRSISWWALLIVAPFLFLGIGLLTSETRITLSTVNRTMSLNSCYFKFYCIDQEFPFEEISRVVVETNEGNRHLVFVLQSGQSFATGAFTRRDGYYEAETAINNFLANTSSVPTTPAATR